MSRTYTPDDVFEDLEGGEMCFNFKGYVAGIQSPTYIKIKDDMLFKFILSNESKKVTFLVWGQDMINKYIKDITSNRIIKVKGGFTKAVTNNKSRNDENVVPFDIIIKQYTELEFLGFHEMENREKEIHNVSFDDLPRATGLIRVSGYIQNKINQMSSQNGLVSSGIGSMTDGKRKINIQVKCFTESVLEAGDHVTVVGTVKDQGSLIMIVCENIDCITANDGEDKMPIADVEMGIRPIKRIRK